MKKILVIDDDQNLDENTAELLAIAGYSVATAVNGKLGFDIALEFNPDIIICDIMMPKTNGVAFLILIKENPATKDIPLIFMSGSAIPQYLYDSMMKNGYDFLSKPFTEKQLIDAIERSLSRSSESLLKPKK